MGIWWFFFGCAVSRQPRHDDCCVRTTYLIKELFEKVQSLPIPFFDKHGHGEVMSSFTNDIDMLNMALEQSIDQILTSVITVVGTFAMMIVISPILTVVVVICLAFMMLIISFIGKRSSKFFTLCR